MHIPVMCACAMPGGRGGAEADRFWSWRVLQTWGAIPRLEVALFRPDVASIISRERLTAPRLQASDSPFESLLRAGIEAWIRAQTCKAKYSDALRAA
eukprot:1144021-Pelagomonas_calceolata.AAC.3